MPSRNWISKCRMITVNVVYLSAAHILLPRMGPSQSSFKASCSMCHISFQLRETVTSCIAGSMKRCAKRKKKASLAEWSKHVHPPRGEAGRLPTPNFAFAQLKPSILAIFGYGSSVFLVFQRTFTASTTTS